jgi:autotransporter-associated beta strand protein
MKKILQSIVLVLLLLAISSNLLASSYSRTAGGSWDDWGWSADWVLVGYSLPAAQILALLFDVEAAYQASKALYNITKFLGARKQLLLHLGERLADAQKYLDRMTRIGGPIGDVLKGPALEAVRELALKLGRKKFSTGLAEIERMALLRVASFAWLMTLLDQIITNILGISTPNYFQYLPDSMRSWVDNNIQLGWSKTGGPWLYYLTWWWLGTPGGMFDDITLFNEGTDPQNLDLNGDRTLGGLNVVGNSWTLSGGTLTFRPIFGGLLRYSGKETLTFETPLSLPMGLQIHVPDPTGTVRLLGKVDNLHGKLWKTGYGTLLMEAPLHVGGLSIDSIFNPKSRWTGKAGPWLILDAGTLGIAPSSVAGPSDLEFHVSDDSRLFALNGDINIPWTLCISPDAQLDVIDNPNDSTFHSITFSGDKYDRGTINQLSHGDLIFEGTDHFEGTINTYDGYGRLVLNGDTGANIQMKGGEIAGIGGTRGDLTARNGAIISPGYNGSFGTLSFGNVDLDSSTILNFTLGLSNRVGNSSKGLIQVNGNLTLAGNLNISAGSGFKSDESYVLFRYGGKLTNNGLGIRSVPEGYNASNFYVQTQMKGQVNLFVDDPEDKPPPDKPPPDKPPPDKPPPDKPPPDKPPPDKPPPDKPPLKGGIFSKFQFWDGGRTAANGIIEGGDGVWNNTDATWSSIDGLSKKRWGGYRAIFGGDPGRIDVQDNVSFRKIDFLANGYTIYSSNNSKLLANDSAAIKVDSTYQAEISAEITGSGSITKKGLGILILSHDNSYTGGTILEEGTLIANTRNALSSGSVTLEDGLLCLGNTQTLEVGSYTQNQDATLALRVNSPTNYDQLMVNGSANLGGTLLIDGKPSNFGKQMPLITTQGLNGRFDNIEFTQTSLKELSANYDDGKNIYVTPHFALIYPYAKTRNARALARHLDLFSNSGRNEEFFNTLADLTLEQVPVALETLVPRQVFALSSIALSVGRSQMHNIQSRPEDLNSGYASYGQLNANTSKPHGLSSVGAPSQMNLMNKAQELWSFYMHGDGSFGRQRQDTEHEVIGYDYGQSGTFAGADYHLNDKIYVGGAVSYTYTDTSLHGDRGSLSTDSYFGHVYTAYVQPKGFNLVSSLSFGDHEFDFKRRALIDTARSQPQSKEVDFQSQVSYNIPLKPNFTVSPYAGLTYSSFWMEEFQEYNSQASLKIRDDQTNSLRSTVGVKAKYGKRFTKGIRKASVETHVGWDHEYCDAQSRAINAEWVGKPVRPFPVQGGRVDPDTLISGVNLRVSITNPLSVTTGYNLAVNQDYVSHSFSVGVNLAF